MISPQYRLDLAIDKAESLYMASAWMIRAGKGGQYVDNFQESSRVAIGWNDLGDLSKYNSDAALKAAYIDRYADAKPGRTANAVAMIRKFRDDVRRGDIVVTYGTVATRIHDR